MRLLILTSLLIVGLLTVAFTAPDGSVRAGLRDKPDAEATETGEKTNEKAEPKVKSESAESDAAKD